MSSKMTIKKIGIAYYILFSQAALEKIAMNGDQEEEEDEDEEELMDDAGSLLKGSCQAVFLKLPYVFFYYI